MKRKLEQPDSPGSKKTKSPTDGPSVSHTPIPMPLLYPYHNHRTFVHLNNSLTIPADDLIVLDGYAFSIAELTENAAANLKDFYRNPHIIQADENTRFSDEAIRQLRLHPVLSVLAAELDGKLALQKNGISEETIDAVLNLLNKLAADSDVIADQAERDFSRYFFSLPNVEQNQLNEYLIYLPTTLGGHQTLKFEAALVGGDIHSRCTHTQQMFLWQFVIDFRPSAYERIPGRVWELLSTHRLRIRTREDYALTEEKPEPVRMAFDPMITLRMRIGLAFPMDMSRRQGIFASPAPARRSLGHFPLPRRSALPVFSIFTFHETIRLALPLVEIMEAEISDQVSEALDETSFSSSPRNS